MKENKRPKNLEELNKLVSKLSLEEIESLSENEILEMAMERPGHPGQYGFMLQLPFFKSQEHFTATMHALIQRLQKIDDLEEKMENRQTDGFKVAQFAGEEYLKIGETVKSFWEKGITETIPKFVVLMGGVGSGKTTIRRQEYKTGYVHFEFGEIFNAIKKEFGEDNPKLSSYAAMASDMILRESLENKKNIVTEIIGDNYELITPVIDRMKENGYEVSVKGIACDPAEAYKRHLSAVKDDPEYLSAHFTQGATLSFFYQQLELGEMPNELS